MKNEMNGLENRFLPAPYVVGGSPARSSARPIAGESMFDEWVGVTTIVPRSAHARATSISPSAWIRASRLRIAAMPSRRLPIGENTKPSSDGATPVAKRYTRSEEHTSELQPRLHPVCRLLLEKKKTARSVHDAGAWYEYSRQLPETSQSH